MADKRVEAAIILNVLLRMPLSFYIFSWGDSVIYGTLLFACASLVMCTFTSWKFRLIRRDTCARLTFCFFTLSFIAEAYAAGPYSTRMLFQGVYNIAVLRFSSATNIRFTMAVTMGMMVPATFMFSYGIHTEQPLFNAKRFLEEFKYEQVFVAMLIVIMVGFFQLEHDKLKTIIISSFTKAAEEKDRVVMSFSHDLRSPLNGLLGSVQLLAMDDESMTNDQKQHISIIRHCSLALNMLVENVLTQRQIEMEWTPSVVDMWDFFSDVEKLLESLSYEKNTRIVVKSVKVPSELELDEKALRRALVNVGANTINTSEDGGTVEVSARMEDDSLVIEVTSTGGEEGEGQLFESYKSDTLKRARGTGMGLPIAKRLMEECLGGSIELTTAEGKGQIFKLRCPVRVINKKMASKKLALSKRKSKADERDQSNKRKELLKVVIVDDARVNLKVVSKMLNRIDTDLEIHELEDGTTCIEYLLELVKEKSTHRVLVILDLHLKFLNGQETVSIWRRLEDKLEGGRRKAVFASMTGSDAKVIDCDYELRKPVAVSELTKLLKIARSSGD